MSSLTRHRVIAPHLEFRVTQFSLVQLRAERRDVHAFRLAVHAGPGATEESGALPPRIVRARVLLLRVTAERGVLVEQRSLRARACVRAGMRACACALRGSGGDAGSEGWRIEHVRALS